MTRSLGGRARTQRTARRKQYQRGEQPVEVPSRGIVDTEIFMIGADDGAGNSPARRYSAYDDAWHVISSPPIALSGNVLTPDGFAPASRFVAGGGYVGGVDNTRFFMYTPDGYIDPADTYTEVTAAPVSGYRIGIMDFFGHSSPSAGISSSVTCFSGFSSQAMYSWVWGYDTWYSTGGLVLPNVRGACQGGAANGWMVTNVGALWRYDVTNIAGTYTPSISNSSLPTIPGTSTDDIRLARNDPNLHDYLIAIRVQGGVATTWHFDYQGGGPWVNTRAPLPRPRGNFGFAVNSIFDDYGVIYVVGGDGTPWLDIYDARTDTWSQGADLDVGVSNVSAVYRSKFRHVGA